MLSWVTPDNTSPLSQPSSTQTSHGVLANKKWTPFASFGKIYQDTKLNQHIARQVLYELTVYRQLLLLYRFVVKTILSILSRLIASLSNNQRSTQGMMYRNLSSTQTYNGVEGHSYETRAHPGNRFGRYRRTKSSIRCHNTLTLLLMLKKIHTTDKPTSRHRLPGLKHDLRREKRGKYHITLLYIKIKKAKLVWWLKTFLNAGRIKPNV